MLLKFSNLPALLNLPKFSSLLSYCSYCSYCSTIPTLTPFFTPRLSLLPYALSYSWVRKIVPVNIKAIKAYKGMGRVGD